MGHRIERGKRRALGRTINVQQPTRRIATFQNLANRPGVNGLTAKEHLLDALENSGVFSDHFVEQGGRQKHCGHFPTLELREPELKRR